MDDEEDFEQETPYNGSSGWSGSDSSRQRAFDADSTGLTGKRQKEALSLVYQSRVAGMTWKQLADKTGWHHGTASGTLSVLHKTGHLARLAQKRNRCKVYIHPTFLLDGDVIEDHGGGKYSTCPHCGGAL
jgi:hypothetical protein